MYRTDYPKEVKNNVFLIWKKLGDTPLQALEYLRERRGLDSDIKMTYAGRLDPLAEGELLILTGEECKKKDEYLGLDKEYEVEILLGVSTDTGDVMGLVDGQTSTPKQGFGVDEIKGILQKFVGKISWAYPIFSSKTVRARTRDGQAKPLFLWSLEGRIDEIDIPIRESKIYELELLGGRTTKLSISKLREVVHTKINSITKVQENIVCGKDTKKLGQNFRREEVLQSWAIFFNLWQESLSCHKFDVVKVRCKCSSGTYMRTLAQKVGEELNIPALALSIVRTRIMLE